MQFLLQPNIDFIGMRKYFYSLSAILALIGLTSIVIKGPNYSIDFMGGTLVQGAFKTPVDLEQVRKALDATGLTGSQLQSVPSRNAVIIRFKEDPKEKEQLANKITAIFQKDFPDNHFQIERVEYVGPSVGKQLVWQALMAIFFSLLGISIYVGFRFRNWAWGFCGVFALLHDVFITAGFMSIMGREMSLTVIAALLTLAGYSINDTIVIFDRMRENLRGRTKEPINLIIDRSLNETLSRTIITSLTVFLVLLALLFFGGEVLRDFSLSMSFGVLIGTYSSIFTAAPMIYDWQMYRARQRQRMRQPNR